MPKFSMPKSDAIEKVRRKNRADFDADENLRLALAYLIQIIGEAASRVSPRPPDLAHYSDFPLAACPFNRKVLGNSPSPQILNDPKSLYQEIGRASCRERG